MESLVSSPETQVQELDLGSLELIKIPVKLGGAKFWLMEADADAVRYWKNKIQEGATLNAEGRPINAKTMGDSEINLVAGCLKYDEMLPLDPITRVPQYKSVPLEVIGAWPHRVVHPLFLKAVEISNLKEGDEAEANTKKPQTSTSTTSQSQPVLESQSST